jgi:hypothetical protein
VAQCTDESPTRPHHGGVNDEAIFEEICTLIEEQSRALDRCFTLTEDDILEYKRRNERLRSLIESISGQNLT